MKRFEFIFMRFIVGAVWPILLFLAGGWISIGLVPENKIFIVAFAGLGAGVLIDILFFRKLLKNVYNLSKKLLIFVYLFYSFCTWGFFMGVPVFNIIPGIMAGVFIGRKLHYSKADSKVLYETAREVSTFTAIVMTFISLLSAVLALINPYNTASDLRRMFEMFDIKTIEITIPVLIGLIVVGGILLIVLQYWFTKKSVLLAYKIGNRDGMFK